MDERLPVIRSVDFRTAAAKLKERWCKQYFHYMKTEKGRQHKFMNDRTVEEISNFLHEMNPDTVTVEQLNLYMPGSAWWQYKCSVCHEYHDHAIEVEYFSWNCDPEPIYLILCSTCIDLIYSKSIRALANKIVTGSYSIS